MCAALISLLVRRFMCMIINHLLMLVMYCFIVLLLVLHVCCPHVVAVYAPCMLPSPRYCLCCRSAAFMLLLCMLLICGP